jgi:hypothetical protein
MSKGVSRLNLVRVVATVANEQLFCVVGLQLNEAEYKMCRMGCTWRLIPGHMSEVNAGHSLSLVGKVSGSFPDGFTFNQGQA